MEKSTLKQVQEFAGNATRETHSCPGCHSTRIVDFFEVRNLPVLVCVLFDTPEAARRAPMGEIILSYCTRCGLIYNRIFDPAKVQYAPGYEASLIYSGFFRNYITGVAKRLVERYDLREKTILEIGCGQGEFLHLLCEFGNNRGIGIDPAIPAPLLDATPAGRVQFIRDYYSEKYAHLPADFICCLSVFEHIPQPAAFLQKLRAIIGSRQSRIYFEVYNAWEAIKHQQSWSIHYEQCNCFTPANYPGLFQRSGFRILDFSTAYAGQYLYVEALPDGLPEAPTGATGAPPAEIPPEIRAFATAHREKVAYWTAQFAEFRRKNQRVVVWGSGGKGMSFLNVLRTGDLISFVVDINPRRQGKYIPGSAQKIVAPEYLRQLQPEVIIITNPLYEKEIREQVAAMDLHCQFLNA